MCHSFCIREKWGELQRGTKKALDVRSIGWNPKFHSQSRCVRIYCWIFQSHYHYIFAFLVTVCMRILLLWRFSKALYFITSENKYWCWAIGAMCAVLENWIGWKIGCFLDWQSILSVFHRIQCVISVAAASCCRVLVSLPTHNCQLTE